MCCCSCGGSRTAVGISGVLPGSHPHSVASQSIPASFNAGPMPSSWRPHPPGPSSRPKALGADSGHEHEPAPQRGRRAHPWGWRSNHTDGCPWKGPPAEGIFIHRVNGTPAVVQESSVPGRLARILTERRRRRAGHDLCRLNADERPIMPRTPVPATEAADPPAAAPSAAFPGPRVRRQPPVRCVGPISKSTLW